MLHVAGGSYFERCSEPNWNQLFGSGLRGAAAISALSLDVELSTYVADVDREQLSSTAAAFGVTAHIQSISETFHFSYFHGLSEPNIRPSPPLVTKAPSLYVNAENILRFGFLEGDAVVNGDNVVYDPQNAHDPRPFCENGSTAKRLAVVLNLREASALARGAVADVNPSNLGATLLSDHGAEVVVIKRGALGATVVTSSESRAIPAYLTDFVWPIGSGDVFTAIFAYHWTTGKVDPFEAARLASLATSYYCLTKVLPIPDDLDRVGYRPDAIKTGPGAFPSARNQVYLAGPFFTTAQRWIIEESRKHLMHQGFCVFSPFHDVGHGLASQVVPADIDALNKSDIVFAILDGLDTGTVFEVGYARAKGIPVVAFVQNESLSDLKMLEGTYCEIVNDFVSAIYRTTWAAVSL